MSLRDFAPPDKDDPFEIDTSVAHPARVYDCLLGGSVNLEADRTFIDALAGVLPAVKVAAVENRRFLRRVGTYLVEEAGIRQFLDIGTGIRATGNVHEVAQSIDPTTRVIYLDNDPIVLAHARQLISGTPGGATQAPGRQTPRQRRRRRGGHPLTQGSRAEAAGATTARRS